MVKLGTGVARRDGRGTPLAMEKVADDARLLEDLGFDFTTTGQHSFTPNTHPAPLIRLAWLAAHTSRLNLQTGILILPLYHPAAIAEQVAELAELSGGRIALGVGVGYRTYEYEGFGIDPKTRGARMDEAVELIHKAFASGEFEFEATTECQNFRWCQDRLRRRQSI